MVVIVALVVMGPKDLPKMLRRLGQWAGKIRRAAADLRAQSGIDDALRSEGLADDIAEIRKLARGELDAVQRAARVEDDYAPPPGPQEPYGRSDDFYVVRDREYPRDGADAYSALPDNAIVYAETLPRSNLARDPLYVMGDANAELPPEPEPEPEPTPESSTDDAALPGAAGPTLIGGVGLPVPYEPPEERASSEHAPEAAATDTKGDDVETTSSDEVGAEARH
ncbi:MAG: Twin-arginine translocation protein TatB [Labilithrix sp.]|nr:Twin-arginine translocation protein TatB [Labilithrix sp.]